MCSVTPFASILFTLNAALSSIFIPIFNRPLTVPLSLWAMTQAMDAVIRPGADIDDFLSLVSLCECGLVLSSRAFPTHVCQNESHNASELSDTCQLSQLSSMSDAFCF